MAGGAGNRAGSFVGDHDRWRLPEADDEFFNSEIVLDSRNGRVASVTPTASCDQRDAPLDPTRGWNGAVQYA